MLGDNVNIISIELVGPLFERVCAWSVTNEAPEAHLWDKTSRHE